MSQLQLQLYRPHKSRWGLMISLLLFLVLSPKWTYTVISFTFSTHNTPNIQPNFYSPYRSTTLLSTRGHSSTFYRPSSVSSIQGQGKRHDQTVIYQKVLHVPLSKSPTGTFLTALVDYLHTGFVLPSDLLMIYQKVNMDTGNEKEENDHCVVMIESPLLVDSRLTRMTVEVVSIYPDASSVMTTSTSISMFPSMVMVVVNKNHNMIQDDPIVTKYLFENSECKILKALDRGLDIFLEEWGGSERKRERVSVLSQHSNNIKVADHEHPIVEDTKVVTSNSDEKTGMARTRTKPGTITKSATRTMPLTKSRTPFRVSVSTPQHHTSSLSLHLGMDCLSKCSSNSNNSCNKHNSSSSNSNSSPNNNSFTSSNANSSSNNSNSLRANNNNSSSIRNMLDDVDASSNFFTNQKKKHLLDDAYAMTTKVISTSSSRVERTSVDLDYLYSPNQTQTSCKDPNEELGFTTDELSRYILNFGDENAKREAEGNGFVMGALQKTQKLMQQERERQRNIGNTGTSTRGHVSVNTVRGDNDIQSCCNSKSPPLSRSREEELRCIFMAGQAIAEGLMIHSSSDSTSHMENANTNTNKNSNTRAVGRDHIVTETYVNDLINEDNTVPRTARSINDMLAELEVCVSRLPGDNFYSDSSRQESRAPLDVFSRPDTYYSNGNSEMVVNWANSLPGIRTDIHLPNELAETVRTTRLVAQMVSKWNEFDDKEGEGDRKGKRYVVGARELTEKQVQSFKQCVLEGVSAGLIQDPIEMSAERSRFRLILRELSSNPEEQFEEIVSKYKDLILSDNFIVLVREHMRDMEHQLSHALMTQEQSFFWDIRTRQERKLRIIVRLCTYAQFLLKEVRARGAELEASQLEIIRSICNVAMDSSNKTDQDTSLSLIDVVRDMRPLMDDNFVAYLKYAIGEEEARLTRVGFFQDPEHNRWLYVLKIIQEGVYAELAVGIQRHIDHIIYILRMKTKAERNMLLQKLVDVMPSMDVRPFVKVIDNIVASLGSVVKGEFETTVLGGMTNKLLQLHRYVHAYLPHERIKVMSRDADMWASKQKKMLVKTRSRYDHVLGEQKKQI